MSSHVPVQQLLDMELSEVAEIKRKQAQAAQTDARHQDAEKAQDKKLKAKSKAQAKAKAKAKAAAELQPKAKAKANKSWGNNYFPARQQRSSLYDDPPPMRWGTGSKGRGRGSQGSWNSYVGGYQKTGKGSGRGLAKAKPKAAMVNRMGGIQKAPPSKRPATDLASQLKIVAKLDMLPQPHPSMRQASASVPLPLSMRSQTAGRKGKGRGKGYSW